MSDQEGSSDHDPEPAAEQPRIFLIVIDDSDELKNALRFACRRAQHTRGRVALLYVIEPVEFQHWLGVGRMMKDEARSLAEQRVQSLASEVFAITGTLPVVYIREGSRSDELVKLLVEDRTISLLVLATAKGSSNPGPIVTSVMGSIGGKVRLPVTLVPGELTPEEIDALT